MTIRHALMATATLAMAAPAVAGGPHYVPDAVPPQSNPGECYARVKIPAQYEHVTETVLKKEAYVKNAVLQPKLRARTEQVMVKEPSVRFAVRQPSYKTVTEQVLTRPSYDKLSVSPPSFKTVRETIQTSAPRLVWKKGNPGELARQGYVIHSTADGGAYGRGYSSTAHYGAAGGERCGAMCEIWCLVEEPGESVSVSRQVMSHPGQVTRTRVPAVYQSVTKQVVADPGGVQEIPVPAEYRSITVEDIVDPGGERLVEVPAEYGQVMHKQLIADERYEWRRVLCQPGTGTIGSGHGASYSGHSSSYGSSTYSHGSSTVTGRGYYGDEGYGQGQASGATTSRTYGSPTYSGHTYSGMGYGDSSPHFSSGSTHGKADTKDYDYESGRHWRKRRRR